MKKIVINSGIGSFGLSLKAMEYARKRGYRWALECPIYHGEKYGDGSVSDGYSKKLDSFHPDVDRADPTLIEVVERLGKESYGEFATLKIVEIPYDIEWVITEDEEGRECVEEKHRSWC